jgi:hypothetical protein
MFIDFLAKSVLLLFLNNANRLLSLVISKSSKLKHCTSFFIFDISDGVKKLSDLIVTYCLPSNFDRGVVANGVFLRLS